MNEVKKHKVFDDTKSILSYEKQIDSLKVLIDKLKDDIIYYDNKFKCERCWSRKNLIVKCRGCSE